MNKTARYILSGIVASLGWLLAAWSFTTTLGHPVSTIAFVFGIAVITTGGLIFLRSLKR